MKEQRAKILSTCSARKCMQTQSACLLISKVRPFTLTQNNSLTLLLMQ